MAENANLGSMDSPHEMMNRLRPKWPFLENLETYPVLV